MENINRRKVLGMGAAGLAGRLLCTRLAYGNNSEQVKKKTPMLHVTDLYRPHMDPDDHWDLACVYALAYRGNIDLKGVLIDHPPENADGRNPDIAAIAQMNLIAGTYVSVAVGSGLPLKSRDDVQDFASLADRHGVRMVLDVLRKSPLPVVINILGSSRDVAIAGKKDPELFKTKCAAIYLNAGTGSPKMSPASKPEYNVTLERYGFAAIFDLPCPIYWMPCFEDIESHRQQEVSQYGTHYKFRQDQILPHMSDMVQNYFAYMFGKYTDSNWLGYLKGIRDEALLAKVGSMYRHMWCTAGLLYAANYTVTRDGRIVPVNKKREQPIFTFDAVKVKCDDNGVTHWLADDSSDRFIFHVRDMDNYQSAMTGAMKSLLMALP